MSEAPIIFDRALMRRFAVRAAARGTAEFLFEEAEGGIADRLATVTRKFPLAAELGARDGRLGRLVVDGGKAIRVVSAGGVPGLATRLPVPALVADEEALPFAAESLDLVVSALALQWVNDLPGSLVQIRRALRPDGLLLAAVLGGDSLKELREALIDAEAEALGGASPRVAPFLDVRDAGGLLQRAGFALPVVDSDTLTVRYATPFGLLRDLRAMGWSNALTARSRVPLRRSVMMRAMENYAERFSDTDGRVRATFEIVYMSGWAPHESQQQPLRPGSARMRLADALGVREVVPGSEGPPRGKGPAA